MLLGGLVCSERTLGISLYDSLGTVGTLTDDGKLFKNNPNEKKIIWKFQSIGVKFQ
jgi:hypothetical protein